MLFFFGVGYLFLGLCLFLWFGSFVWVSIVWVAFDLRLFVLKVCVLVVCWFRIPVLGLLVRCVIVYV